MLQAYAPCALELRLIGVGAKEVGEKKIIVRSNETYSHGSYRCNSRFLRHGDMGLRDWVVKAEEMAEMIRALCNVNVEVEMEDRYGRLCPVHQS